MSKLAILLVPILALFISAASCGNEEDRTEIATAVATNWVQNGTETVSEALVELLTLAPALEDTLGKMPAAETLVAGLVKDQIRRNVAWRYSTPTSEGQALYRVIATAAFEIEIDLPFVGAWSFAVTLPFRLLIDTDARTVQHWTADFDNAAVASY